MLVDREDGNGNGFTGVLPAAQKQNADVECVVNCAKQGGKNCDVQCSAINKNQCENGRNKCSENAVCKDMEDELNADDGAFIRKLSTFLFCIINLCSFSHV